uniref:BLOC-1-related complex subunit 5 n=1 Tax=Strigamia maritima TaxID=126957 RepID=T1J5R9_STRMM
MYPILSIDLLEVDTILRFFVYYSNLVLISSIYFILDSPKLQSKHMHATLRSATPSPRKSPKPQRPRSMTGHDIVVVQEANQPEESTENDSELCRLQVIPTFLPIMRGALNIPTMTDVDVLDKLDHGSILNVCSRYQEHLKQCSEVVSTEQNTLATRVREIDFVISTLTNLLTERQKKFAKYAEKLSKVHEISSTLKRCNMTLKQTMESMETLNAMLPPGEQLEPFVWTTG